ncbi:MAG: hypothetical protein K8I60_18715, partial [Anaerolineae bacterium]|nr:hypothetical protein [Anaerolineae bacterium]
PLVDTRDFSMAPAPGNNIDYDIRGTGVGERAYVRRYNVLPIVQIPFQSSCYSGNIDIPEERILDQHTSNTIVFVVQNLTQDDINNWYKNFINNVMGLEWEMVSIGDIRSLWRNSHGCVFEISYSRLPNNKLSVTIQIIPPRLALSHDIDPTGILVMGQEDPIPFPTSLEDTWNGELNRYVNNGWVMDPDITMSPGQTINPTDRIAFLHITNASSNYYIFFDERQTGRTWVTYFEYRNCMSVSYGH